MKQENIEILIPENELQEEIKKIGTQISRDYQGKELVIISVLKSSVYFLTDLTRNIDIPLQIDFFEISRFSEISEETGAVRITKDINLVVNEKHVILLDVIINTGLTHGYLLQNLEPRGPASLNICTLLHNPDKRLVDLPVNYSGFKIPNTFVVGYGLDYEENYRHLPYIGKLQQN